LCGRRVVHVEDNVIVAVVAWAEVSVGSLWEGVLGISPDGPGTGFVGLTGSLGLFSKAVGAGMVGERLARESCVDGILFYQLFSG
jgi:hypothetical protein